MPPNPTVSAPPDPIQRTADRGGMLLRRGFFILGGALTTAALTAAVKNSELFEVMPLFCLVIFLQFLPLIWVKGPDIFSPPCREGFLAAAATIANLVVFFTRGNLHLRLLPQLPSDARADLVQKVLIATALGTCSYYIGYYHRIGTRLSAALPRFAAGAWNGRRLIVTGIVCAAFFFPAYAYFHTRVGTSLFDLTELQAGKMVWRDNATSTWLPRSILLGFMPILFAFAPIMMRPRVIHVVLIVGVSLLYFVLITRLGQRGYFAFCGLTLIMVGHYLWRRVPLSLFGAAFLATVVITNVLGHLRTEGSRADVEQSISEGSSVERAISDHGEDRGRMDGLAFAFYAFPNHEDYLMGESYAALLVLPIPRWLWPAKGDHFLNRDTNIIPLRTGAPIPTPFLGVLYANFSWLGIVVGMAAYGVFHRALYGWLIGSAFDKSVVLLYVCVMNFFNPTLLGISFATQFVLPCYIILRFVENSRARNAADSAVVGVPAPSATSS